MNTVQQPASDVAISLLVPQNHYQKVSGLRSFSNSLVTILTSVIATAMLSFTSIRIVILFDLITFATAFVSLLCFIKIPNVTDQDSARIAPKHQTGVGWIFIPIMSANMDVLFRTKIPIEMQGRVYSVRNTFQFFTIPLGYLCGGIWVDKVFEPFMAAQPTNSLWVILFGSGKGSGAALLFLVI